MQGPRGVAPAAVLGQPGYGVSSRAFPAFSGSCLHSDFSAFLNYVKGGPPQPGLPPYLSCWVSSQCFSTSGNLLPRGHSAMSGDILVVTLGGGGATSI